MRLTVRNILTDSLGGDKFLTGRPLAAGVRGIHSPNSALWVDAPWVPGAHLHGLFKQAVTAFAKRSAYFLLARPRRRPRPGTVVSLMPFAGNER